MNIKIVVGLCTLTLIPLGYVVSYLVDNKVEAMTRVTIRDGFEQSLTEDIHNGRFKQDLLEIFAEHANVQQSIALHYEACVANQYEQIDLSAVEDFKNVFAWIYENVLTEIVACTSKKSGIKSPLAHPDFTDST